MGRESRRTRSFSEAAYPSDDVNKHVTSITCELRDDISGDHYRCALNNANGATTVEGDITTWEIVDAGDVTIDSDVGVIHFENLNHEIRVERQGGGDILSGGPR